MVEGDKKESAPRTRLVRHRFATKDRVNTRGNTSIISRTYIYGAIQPCLSFRRLPTAHSQDDRVRDPYRSSPARRRFMLRAAGGRWTTCFGERWSKRRR